MDGDLYNQLVVLLGSTGWWSIRRFPPTWIVTPFGQRLHRWSRFPEKAKSESNGAVRLQTLCHSHSVGSVFSCFLPSPLARETLRIVCLNYTSCWQKLSFSRYWFYHQMLLPYKKVFFLPGWLQWIEIHKGISTWKMTCFTWKRVVASRFGAGEAQELRLIARNALWICAKVAPNRRWVARQDATRFFWEGLLLLLLLLLLLWCIFFHQWLLFATSGPQIWKKKGLPPSERLAGFQF